MDLFAVLFYLRFNQSGEMKRSFIGVLSFLIFFSAEMLVVSAELKADNNKSISGAADNNAGRRRRKPGGKGSIFDELEIFKHNADVFAGPLYHLGNGDFFTSIESDNAIPKDQVGFNPLSISVKSNFISVGGGIQYRIIPNHKDRGFASMISYAAGFSFFRRGYEYKYEKNFKVAGEGDINSIEYSEKVRATYLSIPLSIRIGRRLFFESGLGLNFMVHGISDAVLIRSNAYGGDLSVQTGIIPYSYDYPNTTRLKNVVPFFSPGLTFSSGFYFNENLGFRLCAAMTGGFFKSGTNPPDNQNFNSTLLSFQLIGCIN
jgi:hypothetical protein